MSGDGADFLFWLIIFFMLVIANRIVFKNAGYNRRKRMWGGIILLLLAPVVFFAGIMVGAIFKLGFGTGFIAVIYSLFFAVNGLIVLIIAFFTKQNTF